MPRSPSSGFRRIVCTLVALHAASTAGAYDPQGQIATEVQQITFGPKHHFFGYIGHVQTIPWNRSGRYIVALRTDFQERMPRPGEAAEIVLLSASLASAVWLVSRLA